jgi:DNA (cytosine-5)-methyltransferase 1
MGISEAGFTHEAVLEWDRYSCDTIRENQKLGMEPVTDWPLYEKDIRTFDYSGISEEPDLIAGGPPCQPFSLGGRHGGWDDERDMFPEMVRAIRELKPRAIIVENVKGLLRSSFARYFEYIVLQISYPELTLKSGELWREHLSRLERHHIHGRKNGLSYKVVFRLLNAADYGVPQKRERVIIVGFRQDLEVDWLFPQATHSLDALLWDQWVTGEYWDRHGIPAKDRPSPQPSLEGRILRLGKLFPPPELPWTTVRDAISDLPDPESPGRATTIPNHDFNPGARSYHGHTGSPLDTPAKTLKAGDHGVPGGENMLARQDGSVRYFSVRESARLQTFPDEYVFHGSWTETMRQLGNAVPVLLGQVVASNVAHGLQNTELQLLASRP